MDAGYKTGLQERAHDQMHALISAPVSSRSEGAAASNSVRPHRHAPEDAGTQAVGNTCDLKPGAAKLVLTKLGGTKSGLAKV